MVTPGAAAKVCDLGACTVDDLDRRRAALTRIGGTRIVDMLVGDSLPRIC
jgi:hypothetical protein